jgi:hypothetical protein
VLMLRGHAHTSGIFVVRSYCATCRAKAAKFTQGESRAPRPASAAETANCITGAFHTSDLKFPR